MYVLNKFYVELWEMYMQKANSCIETSTSYV